jgi:hypothetical protein
MNEDMSRTELLSEEAGKAGGHEIESEVEKDGSGNSGSSSSSNNNSNSNSSSNSSSDRRGEMEMEGAYGSPGRGLENKSCRKKTFSEIASELRLTIIVRIRVSANRVMKLLIRLSRSLMDDFLDTVVSCLVVSCHVVS